MRTKKKQIVKLTKVEANILLGFAEGSRDCDVDCAMGASNYHGDFVGYLINSFGSTDARVIKKTWNTIIKKLKAVK